MNLPYGEQFDELKLVEILYQELRFHQRHSRSSLGWTLKNNSGSVTSYIRLYIPQWTPGCGQGKGSNRKDSEAVAQSWNAAFETNQSAHPYPSTMNPCPRDVPCDSLTPEMLVSCAPSRCLGSFVRSSVRRYGVQNCFQIGPKRNQCDPRLIRNGL